MSMKNDNSFHSGLEREDEVNHPKKKAFPMRVVWTWSCFLAKAEENADGVGKWRDEGEKRKFEKGREESF